MKTIEERASMRADAHPIYAMAFRNGYVFGAKEQREIDIENACNALYGLMNDLGCDLMDIEKAKEHIRKVMEE